MPSPRLVSIITAAQESRDIIGNVLSSPNVKIDQSNDDLIIEATVLSVKNNGQLIVDVNGPITVSPTTDEIYRAGGTAYVTVSDSVKIAHGAVK